MGCQSRELPGDRGEEQVLRFAQDDKFQKDF